MYNEIINLYKLQQLDIKIETLKQKEESLTSSLDNIQKQASKHKFQIEWDKTHQKLVENRRDLRKAEMELNTVNNQLEMIEKKIYEKNLKSKELHYLLQEKGQEKCKSDDLELSIIELLEEIDENESCLCKQKQELLKVNTEIKEAIQRIEIRLANIKQEFLVLQSQRSCLQQKLSAGLLKEYNAKHKLLKNKVVSIVDTDGICQGCHVRIPSRVYKRLKDKQIVKCEECGRYLFIPM